MSFLVHNLPPQEVFVKKEYLYDLQKGHGELTPGVWISIRSIMGKALYFETLLTEYGALSINFLYQHLFGKKITIKIINFL